MKHCKYTREYDTFVVDLEDIEPMFAFVFSSQRRFSIKSLESSLIFAKYGLSLCGLVSHRRPNLPAHLATRP